ncbi:cysteine--tRNA ligase [Helicobacter heilmannii]|uniref:cysteine--tRNA ligase n=1 Tax=Helicobacter heilmannii TaxID=35817 RepID=UPI0006B34898|nr:cysteine--tRNA ligase [Helicobacter heilmannii]
MYLFDSHRKQKCPFKPLKAPNVLMYVCGPTVYDYSHLGHARSAITFDLLSRMLTLSGYRVHLVKNFTDIDDKIIAKAIQKNTDIQTLTAFFIQAYLQDMQALGVARAHLEPKASTHLEDIVQMVQGLLTKGFAYQTPNGDVYLDTSLDKAYGSLSGHSLELESVSRIEDNHEKKHPQDFALWKAYKGEGDVGYASALGKGRPGWHIECSAMIRVSGAYTDTPYQIDIHGGGSDLFFPHHENEASQSRCAFNQELAQFWVHNGFVNISGEKMSKSLGNSFYIKDALRTYDGEILRNYLLGVHYSAILNFSPEDLVSQKKRLDKLYRLKKRALELAHAPSTADATFTNALLESMQDDLNISRALSVLEEHLHLSNEKLDNTTNKVDKKHGASQILADLLFVESLLGLGGKEPSVYFQLGVDSALKEYINTQIALRQEAKKAKDFARADEIRQALSQRGIALMDTPSGTIWEKII